MTVFNGQDIERIYDKSLSHAIASLQANPVARGRKPSFQGLNGWIYEQTIRSCLEDELQAVGLSLPIKDQQALRGRAKVDLFVGDATAIEIKAGGIFGDDAEKYRKYCAIARNERKWTYLYVTRIETYKPYYEATKEVFWHNSAFFLNEENGWRDFVAAVIYANTDRTRQVELGCRQN